MSKLFNFKIITPLSVFCDLQVTSLVIPGHDGYFGTLCNHTPIIAQVIDGVVQLTDEAGNESLVKVSSGYFDMLDNSAILITEHAGYQD